MFWKCKHNWRPISFNLIIGTFGDKLLIKEHTIHLIKILKEFYEVNKDWEGNKYCGITLYFDYTKHQIQLSMPGYCDKALT